MAQRLANKSPTGLAATTFSPSSKSKEYFMITRKLTSICGFIAAVGVLSAPQLAAFASGPGGDQDGSHHAGRSPTGLWLVSFMPYVCATGNSIPTAAFESLFTFHDDGTLTGWLQNSTITTTRSPSLGIWKRTHGWNHYAIKFIHLRYKLPEGNFLGRQQAMGELVLDPGGDTFSISSTATVFTEDGGIQQQSCANAVGTRMQWS
jgi:hypothetical protein